MKTDMYTKVILTVIAIFLALNFFKDVNIVPAAQASPAPIPEPVMALQSGVVDVNIVQINGEKLQESDYPIVALPVRNYGN